MRIHRMARHDMGTLVCWSPRREKPATLDSERVTSRSASSTQGQLLDRTIFTIPQGRTKYLLIQKRPITGACSPESIISSNWSNRTADAFGQNIMTCMACPGPSDDAQMRTEAW